MQSICFRLLTAELALAEKPADRVAVAPAGRDRLLQWEQGTQSLVDRGVSHATGIDALEAQAARLEAEVLLLRAEAAANR
jgi:hypothetical protein